MFFSCSPGFGPLSYEGSFRECRWGLREASAPQELDATSAVPGNGSLAVAGACVAPQRPLPCVFK